MTDSFFNYASGPGPQTPMPRSVDTPTPSATDPQGGFGTDSGLASGIEPPRVPTVGADLGGSSSRGSTSASDGNIQLGTDSGLASSATNFATSNPGVVDIQTPAPPQSVT